MKKINSLKVAIALTFACWLSCCLSLDILVYIFGMAALISLEAEKINARIPRSFRSKFHRLIPSIS